MSPRKQQSSKRSEVLFGQLRSHTNYSFPCILVPKLDGMYRICTDYRNENLVTKSDSFPIPRINDFIDGIGSAKCVTKFDLLKGLWQVPLTDRARRILAFTTADGLFQYKAMLDGPLFQDTS